jgi:signal transduction histidine kinase
LDEQSGAELGIQADSGVPTGGRHTRVGALVLVVAGDERLNGLVRDALEPEYRTESASTAGAGLEMAAHLRPDLIVCEETVHPLADSGLIAAIRADSELHATPILALIDGQDRDAVLAILRAGVNDYLRTPFEVAELRVRAGNLINARHAELRLRSLRMAEERVRIARDLHDVVIQRLFAVGMQLNAALPQVAEGTIRSRIAETVDELDDVIRSLRTTIFDLQRPRSPLMTSLRAEVMSLCAQAGEQMGCSPRVGFDGPAENLIDGRIAHHLLAVLREALRNIVQHARASQFEVVVSTGSDEIALSIRDDGVGIPASPSGGNGLRNMSARAESLGGTCTITAGQSSGTVVYWTVPSRR